MPARVHHAADINKREGTLGTDSLVVVVLVVVLVVVVLVEWLFYSKRIIIVRGALTLAIFFVDSRRYNVKICFTSNENCHFSSENGDLPKRVVDFPLERDKFRNKVMEIVEDFACDWDRRLVVVVVLDTD